MVWNMSGKFLVFSGKFQVGFEFSGGDSAFSKLFQGDGAVAFGEAVTVFVGEKIVVMIGGNGELEQFLEHPMEMSGVKKINAPDDVGHVLDCVVDGNGQVVAGADVFADDDGVSEEFGARSLGTADGVMPCQRSGLFESGCEIEPERIRVAAGDT